MGQSVRVKGEVNKGAILGLGRREGVKTEWTGGIKYKFVKNQMLLSSSLSWFSLLVFVLLSLRDICI